MKREEQCFNPKSTNNKNTFKVSLKKCILSQAVVLDKDKHDCCCEVHFITIDEFPGFT